MKITVIGAGYVGLVQCVCLADFGFDVTCIEKDSFDEASFSEKQIYSSALDRLARELAAMKK